jgi:hypothetical protein
MANTAILTPEQVAEAMAILDRVRAEQAAEKAKTAPAAPVLPAGVLPHDFVGSAHQPLNEEQVNQLVDGWRAAYVRIPGEVARESAMISPSIPI